MTCDVTVYKIITITTTIKFSDMSVFETQAYKLLRFRAVSEQRKTEERDSRFWPREK